MKNMKEYRDLLERVDKTALSKTVDHLKSKDDVTSGEVLSAYYKNLKGNRAGRIKSINQYIKQKRYAV